jgi:hypothetical protein
MEEFMRKYVACVLPAMALLLVACSGSTKGDGVVKTTPEEILKAYQSGASAGDRQFKDKAILVTGTVGEVDTDDNGVPYLTFALDNEVLPTFNFKKEQAKAVEGLKVGDKVTLQCVGVGELVRTPTFKDCEVAKTATH